MTPGRTRPALALTAAVGADSDDDDGASALRLGGPSAWGLGDVGPSDRATVGALSDVADDVVGGHPLAALAASEGARSTGGSRRMGLLLALLALCRVSCPSTELLGLLALEPRGATVSGGEDVVVVGSGGGGGAGVGAAESAVVKLLLLLLPVMLLWARGIVGLSPKLMHDGVAVVVVADRSRGGRGKRTGLVGWVSG